ncbi:Double-stranded RNA-binding protein 3 [Bienertia sinuspersici]
MYKTKLQEMCVVKSWTSPKYSTVKDGPDHNPRFTAAVFVNGALFESPISCKSMKEAQNKAAEAALVYFISVSSTRVSNSLSPGYVISKDCPKMAETSKSILPAKDGKVPKEKPELMKKQEEIENNILAETGNLKNSKTVVYPQERVIEAAKLDMNSLSVEDSLQDSGLKLTKGGTFASKKNGKINPADMHGPSTKGKGKLISKKYNTPAETSVDLKKQKDPEVSSFLLCNRVKVYTYAPDISNLPKGVTLLQICDDIWVVVSLDYPNEKA